MNDRYRLALVASALLSGLWLSACGSDDGAIGDGEGPDVRNGALSTDEKVTVLRAILPWAAARDLMAGLSADEAPTDADTAAAWSMIRAQCPIQRERAITPNQGEIETILIDNASTPSCPLRLKWTATRSRRGRGAERMIRESLELTVTEGALAALGPYTQMSASSFSETQVIQGAEYARRMDMTGRGRGASGEIPFRWTVRNRHLTTEDGLVRETDEDREVTVDAVSARWRRTASERSGRTVEASHHFNGEKVSATELDSLMSKARSLP